MINNYIEFKGISKYFPGQRALNNISFSINQGEIHALAGENGAGKTTLLNILSGIISQTNGEIYFNGKKVQFSSAYDAIVNGVIKVHQEINLVPEMTVMDNLLLGFEPTRSIFLNRRKMLAESRALLKLLKCNFSPYDKVKNLSTGDRQLLQIAKALHVRAKLISFDEPTSSLTNIEVSRLFKVIQELKIQGITILYITHRLEEIFKICDRVSVLRDGEFMGTYEIDKISMNSLIEKMVGRSVSNFAKRKKQSQVNWNNKILKVHHVSGDLGCRNISFELHKGEILGFYGLIGAKRTETLMSIFGAYPLKTGAIEIFNKKLEIRSPADGTKFGIGLVPENRKELGFIKDLNNCDNISLSSLDKFKRGFLGFFQDKKKKIDSAKNLGNKVGLTPNDPYFMTVNLSGGNQQKVILAKWLSTDSKIFILDEPTKGIDVGAKSEIYLLIEELINDGKSVIMVSDELPEVIGMCDRIIVMREGRIVAILHHNEFDEAKIVSFAVGG